MLDPTMRSRFEALYRVKVDERKRLFERELRQADAQAAARGMFRSGNHVVMNQQAHERELDVRAVLAWQSLCRVHTILGSPLPDTLRDDLKAEMHRRIGETFSELNSRLQSLVRQIGLLNIPVTLDEAHRTVLAKHDIEIDLYVDSLSASNSIQGTNATAHTYNFYGTVGSVQTGANAVANVVQNLGMEDRAALSNALQQVRDAISTASSLEEQQRHEFLEIADECAAQMAAESPNNTKLLTMFNVLGATIQSIASAQPAYQAFKLAVLPLGITLP